MRRPASIPFIAPRSRTSIRTNSGLVSIAFCTAASPLVACPAIVWPRRRSLFFRSSMMRSSSSTIRIRAMLIQSRESSGQRESHCKRCSFGSCYFELAVELLHQHIHKMQSHGTRFAERYIRRQADAIVLNCDLTDATEDRLPDVFVRFVRKVLERNLNRTGSPNGECVLERVRYQFVHDKAEG